MDKEIKQTHGKETFLYALSRTFERASYYGLRSVLLLYMIGETINMTRDEARNMYGLFIGSFIFSQILGGIVGDLVLGNKRSLIIGGILQALGAFSLCIPSAIGLYTGLVFISLGAGLYSPNILSLFGKLYSNKQKLLDSGFMIFYTAINLGVIIGPLLIGYLGYMNYTYGFITSGILMLCAVSIPFFLKEPVPVDAADNKVSVNTRGLKILITIILLGIFWTIYELGYKRISDLEMKFSERSALNIPSSMWYIFSSVFLMPVGIVAAIIWSYVYNSQFIKLTIGFLIAALAYVILFLVPDAPSDQHVYYYLCSLLLLNIAEIHVSPVIYSTLTQYSNPKYLAIIMSLSFVPVKLFAMVMAFFNSQFSIEPIFALKLALIAMLVIGSGLLIYVLATKKQNETFIK